MRTFASRAFLKAFGTGMLLFHVEFVFTVAHLHSLAYKKFFRKFTQFGLLLQEGELRPLRNGDWPLVVQSVEHAQPLGKAAVVGFESVLQELGNLYQGDGLLLVELLVVLVLEADRVQVVLPFRETDEHLEADQVQVLQVVGTPPRKACDRVLRGVVHQAAVERLVLDVLDLQHDAVRALVLGHDIRDGALGERPGKFLVHEGEVLDAVAPVKVERRVEEVYRDRLVLGNPEEHLDDRVVVDVDVLVALAVFCDACGNIASLLMGCADVLEHTCVLFLVHKGLLANIAFYSRTPKSAHERCLNDCWSMMEADR